MIGTLIGMVQMFSNMSDPSKLGPFMAVALLATLYGALVANLFCLPIADKLHVKLLDEETNRTLIIDGILMIRDALRARRSCAKCCWPICPRSIATRRASRFRLRAADRTGSAADGQEKTGRRTAVTAGS
jgi:hypothetical protein